MCGLVGLVASAGASYSPDLAVQGFAQLLLSNDTRGGDSYGIVVIEYGDNGEPHPHAYRQVGTFLSTHKQRTATHAIRRIRQNLVVGKPLVVLAHNRKATSGDITERNCHPFMFGDPRKKDVPWVIGAHNGVLSSDWETHAKTLGITQPMEVDSELIFRVMQKHGDEAAIGTLDPIASMVLVYMKEDPTVVNLSRMSGPLYAATGRGITFWSSQEHPLQACTLYSGLTVGEIKSKCIVSLSISDVEPVVRSVGPYTQHAVMKLTAPKKHDKTEIGTYGTRKHSRSEGQNTSPYVATCVLDGCGGCTTGKQPSWTFIWEGEHPGPYYPICPQCFYAYDPVISTMEMSCG